MVVGDAGVSRTLVVVVGGAFVVLVVGGGNNVTRADVVAMGPDVADVVVLVVAF